MVEVRIGAAPENGTRTIGSSSPKRNSFSLVSRFWPRLMEAKLYLAGSARASAISSCRVLAGTEGCTSTTEGDDEATPIGAKLLIGSYWILGDRVEVTERSLVAHRSEGPAAG